MTLFEHADRYPSAPGFKDRDTSRKAADSMAKVAPDLRARCLTLVRALGARGTTADNAARLLNADVLSIRPRFTELLREGKIKDSGERRANASGRKAKVWVAA